MQAIELKWNKQNMKTVSDSTKGEASEKEKQRSTEWWPTAREYVTKRSYESHKNRQIKRQRMHTNQHKTRGITETIMSQYESVRKEYLVLVHNLSDAWVFSSSFYKDICFLQDRNKRGKVFLYLTNCKAISEKDPNVNFQRNCYKKFAWFIVHSA
jgi:hypothetical protein